MISEKNTFERLVSQISSDERQQLLDKMRHYEGNPDTCSVESARRPEMCADDTAIDDGLKNESVIYRFILWFRALFGSTTVQQLYNSDRIMALFRKINREYPGLIDYRGALLLSVFYEKLAELKKAADFLKPYLSAVYENVGAFYVYLGDFVAPEITKEMNTSVDPRNLAFDREITGELRASLVRRMDEVIKSLPGEKRAFLYSLASSVEWLYQFTRLPFERLISAFSNGISDSQVARFESVSGELDAFAKILCNGKAIPPEALETVFLFTSKTVVPSDSHAKDDDARAKEFMDKVTFFMTMIHMFVTTVPLRYINKVVYNNITWQPEQFSGAEDWFVKYKEQWKRLFDQQWERWLKERKINFLNTQIRSNFGIDKVPLLPDRPWAKIWGGVTFHFENTGGFLYWFVANVQDTAQAPLKALLLEGQFVNNENRSEFANTLNELSEISSSMYDFAEDVSSVGQTGLVFEKLASERLRTLSAQAKIDTLIIQNENCIKRNKDKFCNCARSVLNIMAGVFREGRDTRYDGIQNLASIQAGKNAAFREALMKSRAAFASALDILKSLEQIDMPSAGA